MDRNDILSATRTEFLRGYTEALRAVFPVSTQRLYEKADKSTSSRDQRRYLEARAALGHHGNTIQSQAVQSMEQLLNRAFRTAFSNFRPTFSAPISQSSLSLVDANVVEGELHIGQVTQRYRNAAEESLRDLNIRVALLFDQENIQERENPFRPYLISRAFFTAVEQLSLDEETSTTLIDQVCEDLVEPVKRLYADLNDILADYGIAVELKTRVSHTPAPRRQSAPAGPLDETASGDQDMSGPVDSYPQGSVAGSPYGQAQGAMAAQSGGGQAAGPSQAGFGGQVDRLMQMVRRPGYAFGHADAATDQGSGSGGAASMEANVGAQATSSPGPAGGFTQMARSGWLAGTERVGNALRGFFRSGRAPEIAGSPLEGSTQARQVLTASISGMQRHATPSVDEMYGEDGEVRNLIMENHASLTEMAKGVNEQMIIDVVAMLFEFILRDDQVPAEVRAQLGRLQFLVLKIALMDPAMFTQHHHPARVLVNRIGSISVGLEKAGANTEAMATEIRQIIERLLAEEHENVGLFSKMLDEFDTFIARQLRAADEQVEKAVQAVEAAESRTLQFARTTAAIADTLTGLTLDPYLHDFLINGWAHAIAHAEQNDPAKAGRFWMLIPDLIWSIAPKMSKPERDRLLGQIPTLLKTLKEGIELIGWTQPQQQALQSWLIDAHTHALRTSQVAAVVPSIEQMRERFGAQSPVDPNAMARVSRGEVNRDVLDQTIRELEVELNLLDQVLDQTGEMAAETGGALASVMAGADGAELDPDAEAMARLKSGVAIEINLAGKPNQARLNWINPSETNLVLTIEGDSKPAMVTVRTFLRLMRTGRARFVEAAPLFERAVQSLLTSADQVDRGEVPLAAAA
ncbi:DUF1631 family protein [Chitinimonas sp. BJYL2]|uniref:DUF1631 family protein n=1 Tax=Chitinimonas sp. BJYL2 TaxID=2976696 RepID=UPI0022B2EE5D|nr:DUF1631 family protein [Chitinimonas sp. BJYL2]